jgi:hypothetical protein
MQKSTPMLITPTCHVPGCPHDGDQDTMVKCRTCEQWFCLQHFAYQDPIRRASSGERGVAGLASSRGLCAACRGTHI